MEIILFYFGLAIVIGVAASYRGRSGFGWFMLTILISPILAGLLLFVMPRLDQRDDLVTLAMIEATPEGSRSRQLFAEREAARIAKQKHDRRAAEIDRQRNLTFVFVFWGIALFIGFLAVITH